MTMQSVAVVMTCYNEGPFIGDAVRSVLEQSAEGSISEIVIADDGSNEATRDVLRAVAGWDPRIRVIYGPGGAGLSAQRNLAVSQTQASVLAILDGDDIWCPTKLADQLPMLSDSVGLVYSDFFVFPDTDLSAARRAGVVDICAAQDVERAYFLTDPPIIPSTMILHRRVFDRLGGFDRQVPVFEDTDFFIRAARITRFGVVNAPLIYKRGHSSSITGGRKDLMAHHAFVALRAAAASPRLLPLVPRRLAERARKLGNQRFLAGDIEGARSLLDLAVRFDPRNRAAWQSLIAVRLFPGLAMRMLGKRGRQIQSAMRARKVEPS